MRSFFVLSDRERKPTTHTTSTNNRSKATTRQTTTKATARAEAHENTKAKPTKIAAFSLFTP